MTAIEETNRRMADMSWAMLTTSPPVREVGVNELESRPPESSLLDMREPEEYAHGHVPGANSLPQADLATRLDEVPRDRPVYVICQGGAAPCGLRSSLRQLGFEHVVSVKGGTEAWRAAGKPLAQGDVRAAPPRVVETEWPHAGVSMYVI